MEKIVPAMLLLLAIGAILWLVKQNHKKPAPPPVYAYLYYDPDQLWTEEDQRVFSVSYDQLKALGMLSAGPTAMLLVTPQVLLAQLREWQQ